MDRVHRIEMLVRAADAGSFAKAAVSLGLTPSAVSRAIAELEKALRVVLFYRTTRQLRLTEEGEELYRRGREILDKLADAETALSRSPGRLSGTLRVGLHVPISRHVIMPRLPEFMRRHPDLRIECRLLVQPQDMHAAGFDLLLRMGVEPPDSGLIARKLVHLKYGVYAAPEYIEAAGVPATPDDLPHHRCLVLQPPWVTKPLEEWEFERNGQRKVIRVTPALLTDDREGLMAAALAGGGLIRTGVFDPALIATGCLRRVLADWSCPNVLTVYAMYRRTADPAPKITAFLQFLTEVFAAFDPDELTVLHSKDIGEVPHRARAGNA